MKKHLINISVGFQTMALVAFMTKESVASVAMFGLSTAAFAFLVYLDRKNTQEIDELKKQIQDIGFKVSDMAFKLGWGG
jgi:C4-dicarboxylate transporter